MGEWWYSSTDS